MSKFDWWRSHHGAPTDPKWLLIAKRAGVAPGVVSAIAWALLDHASQTDDRGNVADFDVETYAAFSGFDEADISAVIAAMVDKRIIAGGRLASWERRQPKREDDSTERTRRYRERQAETAPEKRAAAAVSVENGTAKSQPEQSSPAESAPLIHEEAFNLASEIKVAVGLDPEFPPPSWAGCAMQIEAWLGKGWDRHIIIESIRAQMAHRRSTGPPGSVRYFERGIAEAHAIAKQPLPEVIPHKPSRIHGPAKSPLMAAGDRLLADIKGGSGTGRDLPSQMLPDRRGERS